MNTNQPIENQSEKQKVSPINEFLWAFIGLLLTILGTFIEAFVAIPSFQNDNPSLTHISLGVTYQVAGVLFTGCVGGKNAAIYAQIAYLVLGLFKLPVFAQGGGFEYLQYPTFGYILGFIPGAWLCGYLAFPSKPRLESLTLSAIFGLIVIHLCGIIYLIGFTFLNPLFGNSLTSNYLPQTIINYSVNPLLPQLVIVCVVSIVSFIIRLILFY